jgi:hypothetical protein
MVKILRRTISTDRNRISHRDDGSTSLIRLNPEKATTEGETAGRTVLEEAGARSAEKKIP